MINDNPTTKREILLAEILGDTGKILQDCENLSVIIPKITSEYSSEMRALFEEWKNKAEKENKNIINSCIPKLQNEIKDIIILEINTNIKKALIENQNIIDNVIKKRIDKYIIFSILACSLCLFTGVLIGKFIL